MSLSRRFLNLIAGNRMTCGVRSLHCIDLMRQQFFRPSPSPPATRDRKVLCADQSGRAFLFDAATRHLVTMPSLNKPKRGTFSLFVPNAADGGGGFSSWRVFPNRRQVATHTSGQFEAFVYRKPTVTSFAEFWCCQLLPPPPYLRDYKYCKRRHEITTYGVVDGGSQVCISVEDVGTYCLDTVSHTWSHVGEWTLPFLGKVEYVPEFKLWFGLSAAGDGEQQHLAAADLSSLDSQPQLLGPRKELEPHKEWQEWRDAQLVNLGSGRFCIARFFETIPMSGDDSSDQSFVVLTSVEVTPRVRDGTMAVGVAVAGEMVK